MTCVYQNTLIFSLKIIVVQSHNTKQNLCPTKKIGLKKKSRPKINSFTNKILEPNTNYYVCLLKQTLNI